ncbi:MAG: 3-oxoacyl-ACP reductase FabG [Bdellovibrionales bacterium]
MKNIEFRFSKRHALVTGGGQGIGFEIARQFLQSGAEVTIWDYSGEALKVAEAELKQFADRVHFAQVNVADWNSCAAASQKLSGPIHVLVNNAGITRDKSFSKMENSDFQAVIDTNLTGLFNVTKSLLAQFSTEPTNRIINMASVVALYGNFGQTNYVAAKAGVIGMTKTWARELGRKGFTVNAVAPGFTRTAMVEKMPMDVLQSIEEKIPVRRMGSTTDIANACLFLASDEAGYVNGAVLSVDGGLVQ